jgi:methionyl-tRNA formyltransferase
MVLARPPRGRPGRLAFLGTPAVAAETLGALTGAGFDVALVVTRADKRRGRGGGPSPSPVKARAEALGIPVVTDPAALIDAGVDLGVVVAFGRLIRPPVLEALPLCNIHFSLLPRWRGAAPVERAILAGDRETGVCLMVVEEGLDTGAVYARVGTPIGERETAAQLRDRLGGLGARLLVDTLAGGLGQPEPQHGEVTYAEKIDSEELRLDWARPAVELDRLVRVGRAWTTWRGKRLLVLAARPEGREGAELERRRPGELDGLRITAGAGSLTLETVQPEGRAPMSAPDWVRGAHPQPGERFGESGQERGSGSDAERNASASE